ncbi:FecR/PupR family sigma factor regulator, partial [Pseudomonas aeruginosa]
MSLPAAPKVPPQVAEQAVRWLVELQGGADDERLRQAWQLSLIHISEPT